MSATVATQQVTNWQLEDFSHFKKCGEITISPDEQCYSMNCLFCPGICLQFEVFVQHVREKHGEHIRALYEQTEQGKREWGTQTELEIETSEAEGTPQEDSAKGKLNWNETSAKNNPPSIVTLTPTSISTTRQSLATAANELSIGVDMEMELQPEAPQEEVGLVFIVESATPGEMEEETVVDPFEMSKCWCDTDQEGTKHNVIKPYQKEKTVGKKSAMFATRSTKVQKCRRPITNNGEPRKEIVHYLLEAYKNNEKLWNPNHPEYKYNANRKLFNEISESLRRDMNYTLNGADIYAIVKGLQARYRQELSRMTKSKREFKTRFKYFEKMEFLRDVVNNKCTERNVKPRLKIVENETPEEVSSESTKAAQNRKVLSHVLTGFRRQESLWNPKHSDYLKCNKNDLFQEISAQLFKDTGVKMTGDECSTEIQKLRTRYRRELRILHEHKGLCIPKLWCFDQMEFLKTIFEDQLLERLNKKKGVITSKPKTKYLKAKAITFKSTDDHLTFIEIYKSYSALWDVDHPDFRSATYRNEELNQMLEEVNLMLGINSTLEELQKTLFELRKSFSAQKQKILDGDKSPTTIIHSKLAEFLDMNLGPFRCDVCDALIKTSDQYKIHKSGHDGMQPFICTLCGKGFQIPGNLTIHIRRHKGDFPYACEVCEKKFATSTEVAIHMRTHTGERPYICDLCGKSFKTWSFFDIHRRTHLKQSNFHCPICDKSFYERNRYTDHMNGHLNIRKHVCEVCGKAYTTFANLKKHTELHLPVKKYKCDICSKRFAQLASVRWHKRKVHAHTQPETEQMEQ